MEKLNLKLQQVISLLAKHNIKTYEIGLSSAKGISSSIRLGSVEKLQNYLDNNIAITVYNGYKTGYASSGDFSTISIDNIIQGAKTIANWTEDDVYSGLAPKELLAWDNINLELYNPEMPAIKTIIASAKLAEKSALDNKGVNNSDGVDISSIQSHSYYANSNGLIVDRKISRHSISASVIAGSKNDMQSAYDYQYGISFNDLGNVENIGSSAADKALKKLGAKKIKSQIANIIFHPQTAASIFANVIGALSGSNQYKKTSFLLNSVEQKIAPNWLNIIEKPIQKGLLGSQYFDGDGVKKSQQYFVKDGIVKSYILGQYSANQLGLKTTANAGGISNCYINNYNNISLNELIKTMDKGLIITDMMGQGVNITTGNYSRGANGFWVENGEVQYPVMGITIASNLKDMLNNIIAISNDVDNRLGIKTGSMLIENMTISGV